MIRFLVFMLALVVSAGAVERRPNVLFMAVDDLNDWVGCLGGHPQAKTPNIDRLVARGTLFANAHCQAPICNPSRASLMTGRLPSTTGIYYLAPKLRDCASTKDAVTLPQHFAANGYRTWGVGKLFHGADAAEFEEYGGNQGGFGPRPEEPLKAGHTHPLWDWGAFPETDEEMPDFKVATWAADKLSRPENFEGGEPFFLAVGFYRPHVPMYAPKKWFDLHPLDRVQLPEVIEGDLDDVPAYGQDLSWSLVAPRHSWIVEQGQWKHAVQSYLASVSFVDAQVGQVLDALDASGVADETVVVLWTDHGFHLGTKERWGKRSLWEAATKVVMSVVAPGKPAGQVCFAPTGLIDLYPTLNELCSLSEMTGLEGHSLVPLLENKEAAWEWPALTTFGQNNHGVRTERWRYITYADGSEELYDRRKDPNEFENLIGKAGMGAVVKEMRKHLPAVNVVMAAGSANLDARPGSAAEIEADRLRRERRGRRGR